jgi:hypothetical protein
MTVFKGFLIVILSGIAFALAGGLIGWTIGTAMPGYYRAVMRSGNEPWFDPVAVGLGAGLTEGLVCGVMVGCVIVLAVAWYNSRQRPPDVEIGGPQFVDTAGRLSLAQGITTQPR